MSQLTSTDRPTDIAASAPTSFTVNLSDAVRDNPVSAALITMGVAWLFMGGSKVSLFGSRQKRGRPASRARDDEHMDFGPAPRRVSRNSGIRVVEGSGYDYSKTAASISSAVSDAASGLKGAASSATSSGSSALGSAAEGIGDWASGAGETASRLGTSASDLSWNVSLAGRRQAEHLGHALSDFFEDQPLALGAVGLAIGAGIAAVIPATEAESRLMGEASQSIKDQAAGLVGDGFQKAKQFASDAATRVAEEASTQGLTGSDAADAARSVAAKISAVVGATTDAVKKEAGAV